jgi:hypothetical protein
LKTRIPLPLGGEGTLLAAFAFVVLCVMTFFITISEAALLLGPIQLFMTESLEDKVVGGFGTALLLSCICALGKWRNVGTFLLAVLGLLGWIAFGIWIAASASC